MRALPNLTGFDVYIKKENFAAPDLCINPIKDEITIPEPAKPITPNKDFDKTVEVAKQKIIDELPERKEINF